MENNITYQKELVEAGLSSDEALVYTTLLKKGVSQASTISRQLPISRPLVYKVLADLEKKELVEKIETNGSITRFAPGHPFKLREFAERRLKDAERSKSMLDNTMASLISEYNIATGKPGIRFFEGINGIKEVLDDTLSAQETILTYVDLEAIDTYIKEINATYSTQRERRGIKKRGLVIDSPYARKFLAEYHTTVTTTKLIRAKDSVPFSTVMQIYDGKISYITLTKERFIGIIIADQKIYGMHKYLFESLWERAEGITI